MGQENRDDGMNTWDLRSEILRVTHRWYVILVFMFVGAALGWGAGMLWPAPYRATLDLYVGINAYRAQSDRYASVLSGQSFDNVDDYKHWQMTQLNEYILTGPILSETLARLQNQDPAWGAITPAQFRRATRVSWQNAGSWALSVEMDDRGLAIQAIETFGQVALEFVNQAIDHARRMVALDILMVDLSEKGAELQSQQELLAYVLPIGRDWLTRLEAWPHDQPIAAGDHWGILDLVAQAATWEPLWEDLLEQAPVMGAAPGEYQAWLERAMAVIQTEQGMLPGEIAQNAAAYQDLAREYRLEAASSYGLAGTLVVEKRSDDPVTVTRSRIPGTVSLAGGVLGLLVWAWAAAVKISRERAV